MRSNRIRDTILKLTQKILSFFVHIFNEDGSNYNSFKFEYLTDEYIKEITKALNIREKIIIEDFVNDIPSKETAIKLSTSVNSVDVMRNRAKNKIKRKLREKDEK